MLRVSGEDNNERYDLGALTDRDRPSSVAQGEVLLRFADACMGEDEVELSAARAGVLAQLGNDGLVESAAIVGTFNQMVRIADASGIPLDSPLDLATVGFRDLIGLDQFGSSANSRAAGVVKKLLGAAMDTATAPVRPALFKAFAKLRGG